MKIRKFKIIYAFIIWLIIYLCLSMFNYILLRNRLYEKYGKASNSFRTTFYFNESLVTDTLIFCGTSLVMIPIGLVSAGPNFVTWMYSNTKFSIKDMPLAYTTHAKIRPTFMEKTFSITMKKGKIVEDNFYEVLSTDEKFQHLYSDWVKKQIGCEDENIELKLGFQEIDFRNITKLDKDYNQLFLNIEKPVLTEYWEKNIKGLEINNYLDIINYVENNVCKKLNEKLSISWVEHSYYYDFTNYDCDLTKNGGCSYPIKEIIGNKYITIRAKNGEIVSCEYRYIDHNNRWISEILD